MFQKKTRRPPDPRTAHVVRKRWKRRVAPRHIVPLEISPEVKRPPEAIASQTEAKRARPAIGRDNMKNLPDTIGRNERN